MKLKKKLSIYHILQHGIARAAFCLVSSKDKIKEADKQAAD